MVADALSIFVRADQVCFCELAHVLGQNRRCDPKRTSDLHSVHTFAVFCHEVKNPNPQGIGKRAKKTLCFIRGRIHAQHYNGNYFLSKTFLKFYMSTKCEVKRLSPRYPVDFSVRYAQDVLCLRASFFRQLCALLLPPRDAF